MKKPDRTNPPLWTSGVSRFEAEAETDPSFMQGQFLGYELGNTLVAAFAKAVQDRGL